MGRYVYDKQNKQLNLLSGYRVTEVDNVLSSTSENPVQNKVVKAALDGLVIQYTTIPTASSTYEGKVIQYIGETNATYTNGYFYRCDEDENISGVYSWVPVFEGSDGVSESGGHTIVNSSGTDMTQRAKLKFINATVSDDSENDSTIVTVNGSGHTIKDSGNNSMTARTNLKFANAAVTDDSTNDITIITVKDIQVSTMPTANAEQLGRIVQYIGNDSGSYTHGYFYEGSSYVDSQSGDTVYTWTPLNVQEHLHHYMQDILNVNIDTQNIEDNDVLVWDSTTSMWILGKIPNSIQFSELPTASEEYLNRIVQFTGTTPYTNGYFYKCVYNTDHYEWVEWSVMRVTGNTPMLVDVSGASITREFKTATILWTDPEDSVINGQTVAEWGGTKLVRKIGSAPQNEEDGTLLINSTTKNAYSETGYVDDTLEYGNAYYYRFFPYSTINVVTKGSAISVNCQRIQVPLPSQTGVLYYNNVTKSPTLTSEVGITKSGQTSGKQAGDYTMTLSLVDDNYIWADGTSTDKTITWTIQKEQGTITPSKANVTLGRHLSTQTVSFTDIYDRSITSVQSSDTDVCTVTTDNSSVTVTFGTKLGTATITVSTDSTLNCNSATTTFTVKTLLQTIYGFQIDGDESDPSSMVSYLVDSDNYNYTPAHMNFSTGEFDWGSWQKDEFFIPKPCMLRYDGTVAYYLDPDDYTKKADGVTPSDVADSSFGGNAMMEWGRDGDKIWYKIMPYNSGKSAKIYISNYQVDGDYHDWSFHNCDSESSDHFYTAIYSGTSIDNKLRSLSGFARTKNQSISTAISEAKSNNTSNKELWNIETISDNTLIMLLLILMGKSCDSQTIYGKGGCVDGTVNVVNNYRTGVHNTKGLFYGNNTGNVSSYDFDSVVKVFGMENYWGIIMRRVLGYICTGSLIMAKYTYGQEDGSTTNGYNFEGSGYITMQNVPTGSGYTFINEMNFNSFGMFPSKFSSGSSSTYYCDMCGCSNRLTIPLIAGSGRSGDNTGLFIVTYDNTSLLTDEEVGGDRLSCKPLREEA